MSIRPNFAEAILTGSKTFELRRRFPSITEGTTVILYASSPRRAIVGTFVAGVTKAASASELWAMVGTDLGLSQLAFGTYLEGARDPVAIEVTQPVRFTREIELTEMRETLQLEPAQSFRYLSRDALEAISKLGGVVRKQGNLVLA